MRFWILLKWRATAFEVWKYITITYKVTLQRKIRNSTPTLQSTIVLKS